MAVFMSSIHHAVWEGLIPACVGCNASGCLGLGYWSAPSMEEGASSCLWRDSCSRISVLMSCHCLEPLAHIRLTEKPASDWGLPSGPAQCVCVREKVWLSGDEYHCSLPCQCVYMHVCAPGPCRDLFTPLNEAWASRVAWPFPILPHHCKIHMHTCSSSEKHTV